jgi:hypothetical protein
MKIVLTGEFTIKLKLKDVKKIKVVKKKKDKTYLDTTEGKQKVIAIINEAITLGRIKKA